MCWLNDIFSSSTAQISLYFSLHLYETLILLKYRGDKNTHTSPFCRFWCQKLDPNIWPGNVRCSSSCSYMWCSLKHSTWELMLSVCKEFINSSVLLFFFPLHIFVDRASRYIHLKKKQRDAQFIFSIFHQTPLHVSGVSTAHHQEVHRMRYNSWYFRWLTVVRTEPGQQTVI